MSSTANRLGGKPLERQARHHRPAIPPAPHLTGKLFGITSLKHPLEQQPLDRLSEATAQHQPRVAVVGSVNLDFIVGVTKVPERGETVSGDTLRVLPGGKGANQATQAALLGAQVSLVARVGSTVLAQMALETLGTAGVDITHVGHDTDLETGLAFVFVEDTGDNRIVVAPRANAALSAQHVEAASEVIEVADVLLLQLEVPDDAIAAAIRIANEAGCKVILNPAPARPLSPEVLGGVDYLIPNETEAATLGGLTATEAAPEAAPDPAALITAARNIAGPDNVIITLGSQGAMAVGADASSTRPEPIYVNAVSLRQVVDPTGAGDAFCGALGVGIAAGLNLADCLALGTVAGGHAVTKTGAQASMGTLAELAQWLEDLS